MKNYGLQLIFAGFFICTSFIMQAADVTAIIIQLEQGYTAKQLLQRAPYLEYERSLFKAMNLHLFRISETKVDEPDILERIEAFPQVKDAQWEEAIEQRSTEPNDPNFVDQWGLYKIGIPNVWDVTTGGTTANGDRIVVAVLETGFDVEHEDIVENLWQNPDEIPGNEIDDDDNGFVDDVIGWNFRSNRGTFESNGHGQQVIGVVGAVGNNDTGGSGICWDVDIMLCQYRSNVSIFEAYDYIYEQRRIYNETLGAQGAFVVATNASWGLREPTICRNDNMWNEVYELLGSVGVLTAASVPNRPNDIDLIGDTPSACPSDFIISTLNTDRSDHKVSSAAFGLIGVDLGTPGDEIFTTSPGDQYSFFGGASSSAPIVSGTIGLLYSFPCEKLALEALSNPSETALRIKNAILNSVDRNSNLEQYTLTGGRLNVFNSMIELRNYCDPQPGTRLDIVHISPNPSQARACLSYESIGFDPVDLRVFDSVGRLIYETTINPCCGQVNSLQLPNENWTAGIYFVELAQGDETAVEKFIQLQAK